MVAQPDRSVTEGHSVVIPISTYTRALLSRLVKSVVCVPLCGGNSDSVCVWAVCFKEMLRRLDFVVWLHTPTLNQKTLGSKIKICCRNENIIVPPYNMKHVCFVIQPLTGSVGATNWSYERTYIVISDYYWRVVMVFIIALLIFWYHQCSMEFNFQTYWSMLNISQDSCANENLLTEHILRTGMCFPEPRRQFYLLLTLG